MDSIISSLNGAATTGRSRSTRSGQANPSSSTLTPAACSTPLAVDGAESESSGDSDSFSHDSDMEDFTTGSCWHGLCSDFLPPVKARYRDLVFAVRGFFVGLQNTHTDLKSLEPVAAKALGKCLPILGEVVGDLIATL